MRVRDAPDTALLRLHEYGADALSDHELVAILTGNPRHRWLEAGLVRLAQHAGAPARIQAAFELGRRVQTLAPRSDPNLEEIARTLVARYALASQEHLGALYLDSRGRVLREREVYVGTVNGASVATRDVLKYALEFNAVGLILFHNHPSGDPSPSNEDLTYTRKVIDAAAVLDVTVIDHLILGQHRYFSFRDRGMI